jgi:hypothetical protein
MLCELICPVSTITHTLAPSSHSSTPPSS